MGQNEGGVLSGLRWKLYMLLGVIAVWLMYALKTKWAYRVSHLLMSRFVGFVAFQYNRSLRHQFLRDFDLRDPPGTAAAAGTKPPRPAAVPDDGGEQGGDELHRTTAWHDRMLDTVSYSMDEFLRRHNKQPYLIARSVCNEVAQRLTCYVHEYQRDDIKDNAVFKMLHMDYWADMEYWLLLMRPVLMYTFVPEGVGGPINGGSFCCKADMWRITREDGTCQEHLLWDYGYEYLTIDTCWGVLICPIEQFRIPEEPHHRVLLIVPATFVPVPFSAMVRRRKLERLRVSFGEQNVLRVLDQSGREYMSLSTPGSCADCTVPSDLFDILRIKHNNTRLSIRSIEKFLRKEGVAKEYIVSALVYELFKQHDYPPDRSRKTRVLPCEDVRYLVPRPLPRGAGQRSKRPSRTYIPTAGRGSRTVVMTAQLVPHASVYDSNRT